MRLIVAAIIVSLALGLIPTLYNTSLGPDSGLSVAALWLIAVCTIFLGIALITKILMCMLENIGVTIVVLLIIIAYNLI